MEILVFKTDVNSRRQVNALGLYLENTEGIIRWNVDLQDVDNVLRIESNNIPPEEIKRIVRQAGHYCEALEA